MLPVPQPGWPLPVSESATLAVVLTGSARTSAASSALAVDILTSVTDVRLGFAPAAPASLPPPETITGTTAEVSNPPRP